MLQMVRYEIQQDKNIKVTYEHCSLAGLFLSEYGKRLEWDKVNTAEGNALCKKVIPDGGGSYFDLHTAVISFGYRVSKETVLQFTKKYGAKQEHLLVFMKY
jgi:hypothetical protein